MIKKVLFGGPLLVILTLSVAVGAMASALDDAKNQGLIGELSTGYIGLVVANANAQTRALVQEVNARRYQEYQRIAKTNGIALADVEKLAAAKAFKKTRPGNYIKPAGSGWRKK